MHVLTTDKAYLDGLAERGLVDAGRAKSVLRTMGMPRGTFMTAAERFICDAMVSMHVELGNRYDLEKCVDRESLRLRTDCPDPREITDGRQPEYEYAWSPQQAMRQAADAWSGHGIPVPAGKPDPMYAVAGGTVSTDSIYSAAKYAAAKYRRLTVERMVEDFRLSDSRVRSMLITARDRVGRPAGRPWSENADRDILRRIGPYEPVTREAVIKAAEAYRDRKESEQKGGRRG